MHEDTWFLCWWLG